MNENLQSMYLVRHGETLWSLTGQHTGRTDLPVIRLWNDTDHLLINKK